MKRLSMGEADVNIRGYLRIRADGKVIYFDPTEGDLAGGTMLRICGLNLKYIPSKIGELLDLHISKDKRRKKI